MDKDRKVDHVVVITTSYPDGPPGSEAAGSFVEDFVLELSKRVKVSVVAAGKTSSRVQMGAITIYRFAIPKIPLSLLDPKYPGDWGSILFTLYRGYKTLELAIGEHRPTHLFALWALPSGYWARVASWKYGVPYSIWALGSDIWGLGKIPLIRSVLRQVLINAANCYADGYELKDDVQKISDRRCDFLPSTRSIEINVQKRVSTSGAYNLAFLGRWHPNKGPDILLDALALLTESDWTRINEVRCFGGGPMDGEIRKKVDSLKRMGKPITLGGFLNKAQAVDLIAWSDYLMVPSRIESIPVIFSDAVKVGTPMIATPVGDLKSLFNRYDCGVVASEANAVAYCEAIKSGLFKNPSVFKSGLEEAREDFNLSEIVDTFLYNCDAGA